MKNQVSKLDIKLNKKIVMFNINTNYITLVIISIIIVFCIIYLVQCSYNKTESFSEYRIKDEDQVLINSLTNVLVGGDGITLQSTLDTKYVTNSDYNSYKSSVNNLLSTNKTEIFNKVQQDIKTLQDNVALSFTTSNSTLTTAIANINTNSNTLRDTLNSSMSNIPPPLTIVANYNSYAPSGWQLCNGELLTAVDGTIVYYKATITGNSVQLHTPDLRGRMILGVNFDNTSTALTSTKIGDYGGTEKHTLTIDEMPPHNHGMRIYMACFRDGGCDNRQILHPGGNYNDDPHWMLKTGGKDNGKGEKETKEHNNMSPFYVLNYIIKKPARGGTTVPENVILIENTSIANPQQKFII